MYRGAVAAFVALVAVHGSAMATPADYCAAYARDFADAGGAAGDAWKHRYTNAERACLYQYTDQIAKKPLAAKPVRSAAKAESAPPPKPVAKPAPETGPSGGDEPQSAAGAAGAVQKPQLVAGSKEWLDYCTRKYASFNAETGTYKSYTGVERKCLVTADFK